MKLKLCLSSIASLCALVFAQPAAAVAFVPIDVMGTAISGAIMDAAGENADTGVRSRQSATRSRLSAASVAGLNYSSSSARTRKNITAFADKTRSLDPNGAAKMEQLFASQDVMGAVEGELRKVGLTKNNLADAYTFWWTTSWLATQGRADTLPREQFQTVKRQAEAALLSTSEVAGLNDAQKQEFAEALIVQALLIGASVEVAMEQGTDMGQLKAAVAKGARATGLDLSAMTLTDDGFVSVRTGEASGSVPTAKKALAMTTTNLVRQTMIVQVPSAAMLSQRRQAVSACSAYTCWASVRDAKAETMNILGNSRGVRASGRKRD